MSDDDDVLDGDAELTAREITLPDGRYLIFYTFEHTAADDV